MLRALLKGACEGSLFLTHITLLVQGIEFFSGDLVGEVINMDT